MILSQLPQSYYDETRNAATMGDSSSRNSLFKIESGRTSYGSFFSSADRRDYYRISPGIGSFTLFVTADAANGFLGSEPATSFSVAITDSAGNVLLSSTVSPGDAYSRYINFNSPNNSSYWIEVGNATQHGFSYAAALVAADRTAPTVASFSPADGATRVATGANLRLVFNEAVQRGTGNIVLKTASGTTVETFNAATSTRLSISGDTLTIDPGAVLAAGTGYRLEFAAGTVRDLAGNSYAGTTSYDFTTATVAAAAGPTVTIADSLQGIANAQTSTVSYALTFSDAVSGLEAADFAINNGTVAAVSGSGTSWIVQVTPRAGIASGNIVLTLNPGAVTDSQANPSGGASDARQTLDTLAPMAPVLRAQATFQTVANPQVTLNTSLGDVVFELDPDHAPLSVANMLDYVNDGFYADTLFHRVIQDFMVQGGGFTTGMVAKSPTYAPIPLESANGLSNLRGTLAMARTSVADSGTSQFYVNLVDNLFLDYTNSSSPGYAVFGRVISGMDVIDAIATTTTGTVGAYANVPQTDITISGAAQTQTGSSVGDSGLLFVDGIESGATWEYSVDAGDSWHAGTGASISLAVGTYAAQAIQVRQTDAAGNISATVGRSINTLVVEASSGSDVIADVAGTVASSFRVTIPDAAFVAQNPGDTLGYAVTLADGSPLPAWMSFSATRRAVECLPTPADTGSWALRVTATDPAGGITVQDVNVTVSAAAAPTLGSLHLRVIGGAALNMAGALQYYVATNPLLANATTIRTRAPDGTVQEYSGSFSYTTTAGVTRLSGGTLNGLTSFAADGTTQRFAITGMSLPVTTYLGYAQASASESLKAAVLAGNDLVEGGSAADTLNGYAGDDSLAGGAGDDTYVVDSIGDVVVEAASGGTDTVRATVSYGLSDNIENLRLEGTVLYGAGNGLANSIVGNAAANVLDGRGGADTLAGGAGNDSYTIDAANDIVVEAAGAGTDTVFAAVGCTLAANVERLTLTGSGATQGIGNGLANTLTGNEGANDLRGLDGADALLGGAGADTLYGGAGNDTLDGGSGADSLVGGAGNDVYDVASLADIISEDLAGGIDTVRTALTVTLAANVENLLLQDGGTAGSGNGGANLLTGNGGANTLAGGAGNDTLQGAGGDDSLGGEGGSDRLEGGAGNDSLDGGDGGDVLLGGAGDDRYRVDLLRNALGAIVLQDMVSEATGQGSDTVVVRNGLNLSFPAATLTLGLNLEGLDLAETASLVLNLTGNALDNSLTGNAAANRLDGGLGADTLAGGSGNDTYWVAQSGDLIVEAAEGGTDTALVGIATAGTSWTLADNLENATLSSLVAGSLVGNGLDNALTGNNAVNTLSGGDGNDSLDGRGGADSLVGGLGDDSYVIDLRGDAIVEAAAGGTDSVLVGIALAGAAWTLVDNLENATLAATAVVGLVGNGLDNTLTGNAAANSLVGGDGNDSLDGGSGNDSLNGGAGDDSLSGGLGNDSFVVDSVGDSVTDSGGIDTVQSAIDYSLGDNIENLSLTGSAVSATGNGLNNIVAGNAGNNVLNGADGNDTLQGNAGDDTLDGGTGNDVLTGGDGSDHYVVDSALDRVVEVNAASATGGIDEVRAALDYTLGANVENLTLTGTANLNGTGNALANVLTGNSGNNILDGGAGLDSFAGGAGNDTYVVGLAGELATITENAEAGSDTLRITYANLATVAVSLTLSETLTNIENITVTGAGRYNLTGNAVANLLIGNAASNLLAGGEGDDTLDGGVGSDTLDGGAGNDTYVIDATDSIQDSAGTDTVVARASYTLDSGMENLTLAGTLAINGSGNAANNVLLGNAAANVLRGGAGDDTYVAGLGDTVNDALTPTGAVGGADELHLKVGQLGNAISSLAFGDLRFAKVNSGRDLRINIGTAGGLTVQGMSTTAMVEVLRLFDAQGNDLYGAISLDSAFGAASTTPTALTLGTAADSYGLVAAVG